jgi:hypothetical protein
MNAKTFVDSLTQDAPPSGLGKALQALWYQAKGNWDAAHQAAQAKDDGAGAWVHAYLHRVEGDESNAGFWYRRAGKAHATSDLKTEWHDIVQALL